MKVLIVDDSDMIRRSIERILGDYPFEEIRVASNANTALTLFRAVRPELVTLDITLPEMDGLAVLKIIHELEPKTKVLIISALADSATAIEALKRGASSFICKPFNAQELAEVLSEIIL